MTEKRRSSRNSYNLTVQLAGMQPGAASTVAQPARAIDVNQQGALVECRSKFDPGAELMIHNLKNARTGLFRVIRVNQASGGGWQLGLELVDPAGVDFWA